MLACGLAVSLPATAARADGPLTPSALSLTGPFTVSENTGNHFEVQGSLTIGGSPAPAGTEIDIYSTDEGTGVTSELTTTTDADGNFSAFYLLDAPETTLEYTVTYPGNATTAPASDPDAYTVMVGSLQMDMLVANQQSGFAGQPVNLEGWLFPYDGGGGANVNLNGLVITVTRSLAGSSQTASFTTTTNEGGEFTLTDTPTVPGAYTYTFDYDGNGITDATGASDEQGPIDIQQDSATLTLAGPSSAPAGKAVTLTGTLKPHSIAAELGGTIPLPDGTPVTIRRTGPASGTSATFTTKTTDANGDFTLANTPAAAGSYTYTASYAGSTAVAAGSSSPVTVAVGKNTPALLVSASPNPAGYDGKVTVTAHLGTTATNRTVSIYATPFRQATRLVTTGKVNSAGNLTATVSGLTRNYSISAEFSGDAEYAPAKATTALGVAAGVTQSLSGYYTSTRAGNGVYRVYHHNAAMRVSTTVAPGKAGQCVEWQVDRYYGGAWHAYATSHCSLLSKASTDSFRVPLGPDGQYKIRVNYIASAGAAGNVSGSSSWQGFTVTN